MIKHVIMTRFNLATPGREEDIRNKSGWLERRFHLFEKYCLPSIASQEFTDFIWVIYFDKDTPPEFKQRIEKLRSSFPFIPYFTGLFPSEGWKNSVFEILSSSDQKPEWLLTTRLDNDDALAVNYTARVRDAVENNKKRLSAFNITKGCITTDTRTYEIEHRNNAFFSLLEPFDENLRTAPSIQHMNLQKYAPIIQIPGDAGWLQVVHEENVSNKIRGKRVRPSHVKKLFCDTAVKHLEEPHFAELFLENSLVTPVRLLRDRVASWRHQPTY